MKALIVSLESFQKGEIPEEVQQYILANHGNIFTILDESSKIKTNNPCKDSKKSKRTQAIMRLNKIGQRCILTGTFTSKSPVNAYDQMNFLKDGFFDESMFAFAEQYTIRRTLPSVRGAKILITEKDYETIYKKLKKSAELNGTNNIEDLYGATNSIYQYYGIGLDSCKHILEHPQYTPFKHLDELWKRIGDTCFKVDRNYTVDMPPKVYKTCSVELTAEQKKLYLQLQNQYCTDKIVVENGLSVYLRMQDVCNGYEPIELEDTINDDGTVKHNVELRPLAVNPKLDMLEEVVDDIGDEQIVIWCSRSKLLYDAKARLENLGYTCGVFDGKNKNRQKDYSDFEHNNIQILFLNQASGAYGLDKLKDCCYAIYLSNSYSVEHRTQSEDRIYRGIVKTNKYIIDISCSGTCEKRVEEALKLGKELLSQGETDTNIFTYYGD